MPLRISPRAAARSRIVAIHQLTRFHRFHRTCSSRHSNQFATKPLILNSVTLSEIRTSLGDQGSQVRVLSPRRTRNLISVQGQVRTLRRWRRLLFYEEMRPVETALSGWWKLGRHSLRIDQAVRAFAPSRAG
jgi:hypothetical protein